MNNIAKSTIVLMSVTMISKLLGFGREIALTTGYGATSQADAYITASGIPMVIFAAIGSALATVFIPLYLEVKNKDGEGKSLAFANNVFNIVIIISLIVSIIGFVFAEPLVKLFAMNFSGQKLQLSVSLTRIMIFGVIFIGLSNIMTSWLQIKNNFIIPGITGLPYNIIIIISIFISLKLDIRILAIGTLIATMSQFIMQVPYAYKTGYKYKLSINLKDEYLRKMIILIIPVFIGVAVNQVNAVVDRSLASTLGDGIITVLNSANRLNTFVIGLFISTLAAVIYPTLSKLSNDENKTDFIESIKSSINSVVLLIIPISIGAIVLSKPVVSLIFERGAFDSEATNMTAIALSFYSIGMIGFALREILSRIFYALQDTRTPMINGALSMILNVILNLMLIKFMGYAGLAFATSMSAIICIILMFISLKKKLGYFGLENIISTITKSTIAAIIMGIACSIVYKFISSIIIGGFVLNAISLFITIVCGAIIYGILLLIFKVKEVYNMYEYVKSKILH